MLKLSWLLRPSNVRSGPEIVGLARLAAPPADELSVGLSERCTAPSPEKPLSSTSPSSRSGRTSFNPGPPLAAVLAASLEIGARSRTGFDRSTATAFVNIGFGVLTFGFANATLAKQNSTSVTRAENGLKL